MKFSLHIVLCLLLVSCCKNETIEIPEPFSISLNRANDCGIYVENMYPMEKILVSPYEGYIIEDIPFFDYLLFIPEEAPHQRAFVYKDDIVIVMGSKKIEDEDEINKIHELLEHKTAEVIKEGPLFLFKNKKVQYITRQHDKTIKVFYLIDSSKDSIDRCRTL